MKQAPARFTLPDHHTIFQQTIHNQEFRDALERGLITACDQVFTAGNPTYMSGYIGQSLYYQSAHHVGHELKQLGFRYGSFDQQIRVFAPDTYTMPVHLIFCGGRLDKATDLVTFRWERGITTKRSVWQNRLWYPPLQPRLFVTGQSRARIAREVILVVVYQMLRKRLVSWIVLGTEWIDGKTLYCPEWSQICDKDLEITAIPDILPVDDDSDYEIPFAEKPTGTYD